MNDLLKAQIHDQCRLALPEGLKELMWDISREVLRAQPRDLYKFIADYLSALLVTRENLSVAAHMCDDVCNNICHSALDDELKYIGLSEAVTKKVKKVIETHFAESKVNESNLLVKLVQTADVQKEQLQEIQIAVRKAFLRYQTNRATYYEMSSSDSEMDEVDNAVRHTLHLYKHSKSSEEQYNKAAVNIQAAYRAFGVRRNELCTEVKDHLSVLDFNVKADRWHGGEEVDVDERPIRNRSIRFHSSDNDGYLAALLIVQVTFVYILRQESQQVTELMPYLNTASSSSLAGSYLNLPKYKPYSIHNCHDPEVLTSLEEVPEKEHANIDYTLEESNLEDYFIDDTKPKELKGEDDLEERKKLNKKIISFHEIPSIIDIAVDSECVSDSSVEEDIRSELSSKVDDYVADNDDGSNGKTGSFVDDDETVHEDEVGDVDDGDHSN